MLGANAVIGVDVALPNGSTFSFELNKTHSTWSIDQGKRSHQILNFFCVFFQTFFFPFGCLQSRGMCSPACRALLNGGTYRLRNLDYITTTHCFSSNFVDFATPRRPSPPPLPPPTSRAHRICTNLSNQTHRPPAGAPRVQVAHRRAARRRACANCARLLLRCCAAKSASRPAGIPPPKFAPPSRMFAGGRAAVPGRPLPHLQPLSVAPSRRRLCVRNASCRLSPQSHVRWRTICIARRRPSSRRCSSDIAVDSNTFNEEQLAALRGIGFGVPDVPEPPSMADLVDEKPRDAPLPSAPPRNLMSSSRILDDLPPLPLDRHRCRRRQF
jgi:hypothetical protein